VPQLSLEDRYAIEGLVNEYAWLLDHQRWHEVADLCTDDAVLSIRRREIVGKEGLAEWAEYRAAKGARKTLHQMTNLRIDAVDQNHATGVAALVLHMAKGSGNTTYVDLVGDYHDEYVRTPDGWRFRRRRLVNIGTT
jgi:3-phenylpropionate/cinnamic acid dioxygenase small subunit